MFYYLLKSVLLPPNPFIVLNVLFSLLRRPWAKWAVIGSCGLQYLMATPVVAGLLMKEIQPYPSLSGSLGPATSQAIVVLSAEARDGREYGGDTVGPLSLGRLRYAAHLHRLTGAPVLTTGGPFRPSMPSLGSLVADVLRNEFGVPVRWIETRASDTRENARFSATLLRSSGVTEVLLVSSAWHMRRAVPLFAACGLTVTPAPSGFQPLPKASLAALLPSQEAALASYYAAYEMMGIWRDWLLQRFRGPASC